MTQIATAMTCLEFAERVWNHWGFDQIINEQYWEGGCNTEELFRYLQQCASDEGVTLTDADEWPYDDYFYELYKCTEKGLS